MDDPQTRKALENFSDTSLDVPGVSAIRIGEEGSPDELAPIPSDRGSFKVAEPRVAWKEREASLRIVTLNFRPGYRRKLTREQITERGDNLDRTWLRDESCDPEDDMTEPDEIAAAIMGHLRAAPDEIEVLSEELEDTPAVEAAE